jgi:hypothetical protein
VSGSPAIAQLRARLATQLAPPLAVTGPHQYFFDEDSAAYAELEVKRGDAFCVVVVIGSLPSEQFIVDVWHRHAPELWLVDVSDDAIYVARAGAPAVRLDRDEVLRSRELPGVAIPVAALFAPPMN